MRRRYRKTTDLRPYAYIGLTMLGLIIIGVSFNSFSLILLATVGLIGDVLGYGILVQHWRWRASVPISQAAMTRSKRINTPQTVTTSPKPKVQNLKSPEPRLARLMQMSGVEFERFVGEDIFKRLGYAVEYTPTTGDGGIDLLIRKGSELAAVQCKRYSGTVDGAMVRDLNGVVGKGGFERGYLITTGAFSAASREWVKGTKLALIDGERLIEWLDYIESRR
jgi:hypothetical protein